MTVSTTDIGTTERAAILEKLKTMMRRDLKLGSDIVIDESTPFSGGDADIDSLDVLLLVGSIEKEFGIKISNADMGRQLFRNVGTLVDFLVERSSGAPAAADGGVASGNMDIIAQLPHRPPFRFVSKLTAIAPGKSAEGVWVVTGSEDFFAGHFPGRPIVPGVLVIEAMAQLSGLAANIPGADGRLAMTEVRIESAVVPPAEIVLKSRVTRAIGDLIQYEVEALCGQTPVASGTISLHWRRGAGK